MAMATCPDAGIAETLCHRRRHGHMPAQVAEALAASPHARIHARLVERADTPLHLITTLAARDPSRAVRLRIAMRREVVDMPLDVYAPEEAYALLARDP